MGFSINYRSTRPVSSSEAERIGLLAATANEGRTWLSCEPVHIFLDDGGHLLGSSKPNFHADPDDTASATREGLPDGTARDMLNVLCRLGSDHSIDWEISHDYSGGPIGYIRGGVCDQSVLDQVESFGDLGDILGELGEEGLG